MPPHVFACPNSLPPSAAAPPSPFLSLSLFPPRPPTRTHQHHARLLSVNIPLLGIICDGLSVWSGLCLSPAPTQPCPPLSADLPPELSSSFPFSLSLFALASASQPRFLARSYAICQQKNCNRARFTMHFICGTCNPPKSRSVTNKVRHRNSWQTSLSIRLI
jgi:hypothetical protein